MTILYHGSNLVIEKIDLSRSKRGKDFGQGFYLNANLEQAKAMDNVGYDPEHIRGQTGWFKGADSKWRFEISDKDAKVNREVLENISSLDNLYAKREQLLSDIKAFENLTEPRQLNQATITYCPVGQ